MSEMFCCSRIRQNSARHNAHIRILTNPATRHLCPPRVSILRQHWRSDLATIQKWGNSLAVRIPAALANQLNVDEGAQVQLEVRDGEFDVRPLARRRLNLKDLLRDCQPSQLQGETDFGPDVGREVIE